MVRVIQVCSIALFALLLLSSSQVSEQAATFVQVLEVELVLREASDFIQVPNYFLSRKQPPFFSLK